MAKHDIQEVASAEVSTIAANLSDHDVVDRLIANLFKKRNHIDILVNNTGGPPPGKFEELSIDQ